MADRIQVWDSELGQSVVRDATPEEQQQIDSARAEATRRIVPVSVAMWQARAMLIENDLLSVVLAAIDSIEDEKEKAKAHAKFEYSSTMLREDPLVSAIMRTMGKTDEEIDALFVAAASLR
jgi:hypothetical protein